MKELFVSYNVASLAKEKGFDEECLYFYNNIHYPGELVRNINHSLNSDYSGSMGIHVIMAPLYQQLIDWFREKHKIHIGIFTRGNFGSIHYLITETGVDGNVLNKPSENSDLNIGYYGLLNKALEEAFKLI